jgi:5'(3')-deoxyribonucleotidase
MIDPRRIGFDIDDVVADTMGLFVDIGRELYGVHHIRKEDMTCYHLHECLDMPQETIDAIIERIVEGDYPCRLSPIDGADRVLERLGVFGPIRMVTARPLAGPIEAWMAQLLPPERCPVSITATGSFSAKADVLTARNIAYFVDDRLETCYLLREKGIVPVLFAKPWNRQVHPFLEVHGWSELEKMIDFD